MKKTIVFLILGIMIWMITTCSTENGNSRNITNMPLSSWVGTYIFEELFRPDHSKENIRRYEITIYEESGEFFAIINIDALDNFPANVPWRYLRARVFGNEEWISLTLICGWGVLNTGSYPDVVLISFRRVNTDIYTYWGNLRPFGNYQSNRVWFEKIDGELPSMDLPKADLSSWVGMYVLEERLFGTLLWGDETRHQKIIIYETNGNHFAHIFESTISSHNRDNPNIPNHPNVIYRLDALPMPWEPPSVSVMRAEIVGSEEWISLILLDLLSDRHDNSPQVGSVLLSFRKENDNIYTYWGSIWRFTKENRSNMIHFEKVGD